MYEQPYNPYAPNQAIVKDYFKSPKVLARGIMQILMLLMMIGTAILFAVSMNQAFSSIAFEMDDFGYYDSGFGDLVGGMTTSASIVWMLIAAIPVVVLAVGYILAYTGSRKETGKPNAGIMILFVMAIISLAETCLVGAVMVATLLMGFSVSSMFSSIIGSSYYYYPSGAFTTILIIYAVIIVLALTYSVLYSVHRMRFFNSVRRSLNSVELRHNGATGFGVMSIISAVFTGLSIPLLVFYLVVFLNMLSYTRADEFGGMGFWVMFVLMAAYVLIGFIATILDASIALGYKKHIENYISGYNTPYGAAPGNSYAAAPGPAPYAPYQQPAQPNYQQPVQRPYPQPAQPSYQPEPVDMQQNPYGDSFGPTEIPAAPAAPFIPAESFEDLSSPEPLAPAEPEPVAEPAPEVEPEPVAEPEPFAEPEPQTAPEPEAPANPAFCTNCGSRVEPGSLFCSNCGNKLR